MEDEMEKTLVTSFSIDRTLLPVLDECSKAVGLSRSRFINQAIKYFIEFGVQEEVKREYGTRLKNMELIHEAFEEKKKRGNSLF